MLSQSFKPVSGKSVITLGAFITLAALTGCVSRTREVVVERPTQPAVIVQPAVAPAANVRAMPGPINETRPISPGTGYNWRQGYWTYDGARWVWQPGQWVQYVVPAMPPASGEQMGTAPSSTHSWVPGYWEWDTSANNWRWVAGGWRQ